MIGKKMASRIKATVLSAVMTATVFISPAAYQMTQVTAADKTVNHDFVTTSSTADDATNKAKIDISGFRGATTLTFNFETDFTGDVTIGTYGNEIAEDPWWVGEDTTPAVENQQIVATPKDGKISFTYKVPASITDVVKTVGIGVWYPKDGTIVTLTTISGDGSGNTDPDTPGEQDKPVTENTKSGSWSFKDLGNGFAEISSTLTAEVDDQEMDYLLTAGHDEESYIDPETGQSTWTEGDPINSHKFTFAEFGLEDLTSVDIQSFNYTITSDEEISKFMYGGGINVEVESPADTEFVKGKDGYWYNDQGEEDMAEYGDKFEITPHGGYTVTNAGTYMEVVWDVPQEVQEHVSNFVTDTVGFQFWYAQAANPPEGEDYAEVSEVHLKSASCTYTRTLTVPYNKTVNKKIGKTLTPGSDESTNQYKFSLAELGLENRDLVSAVKFNVTASADLTKFTGGAGISVLDTNGAVKDGWYMPDSNITVLEPGKTFEIMWIIPEKIRKDIDVLSADGNLMFGAWYAGEDAPTITLNSIDFYEFLSNEDDLTVEPEKVEIAVGEEKELTINVPGCSFVSSNSNVCIVEDGVVKGLAVGQSNVLVTTPEGQEKTIVVKVAPAPTTTVVTTTAVTTTTTTVTTTTAPVTTTVPVTTVDPDDVIDWSKVLYGDVNLDTKIDVADVVCLNMYILNSTTNKLNATARENAQCVYDGVIDSSDSAILLNYVAMIVPVEQLGPQEGQKVPFE